MARRNNRSRTTVEIRSATTAEKLPKLNPLIPAFIGFLLEKRSDTA